MCIKCFEHIQYCMRIWELKSHPTTSIHLFTGEEKLNGEEYHPKAVAPSLPFYPLFRGGSIMICGNQEHIHFHHVNTCNCVKNVSVEVLEEFNTPTVNPLRVKHFHLLFKNHLNIFSPLEQCKFSTSISPINKRSPHPIMLLEKP